jgi:hypothetical protein
MGTMIVRLKVKDYGSWRQAFDAGRSRRETAGLTNERVYRSAEDGNDLVLLMDAADLDKAREFAASADRKAAMQRAGVVDTPVDYFVE